jgi:hypothetical protein
MMSRKPLIFGKLSKPPDRFGSTGVTSKLRAMTLDTRYATADHGDNGWERRHDLVEQAIRRFGPVVLATQVGVGFQLRDLHGQLGDYALVGAGRDDGQQQGEFAAIFFRHSRFSPVKQGHFWLSETPEIIRAGWRRYAPILIGKRMMGGFPRITTR